MKVATSIRAVLIAGPTASGKSALALELARATGGVVINADSMQVYRDLRIITARPTQAEEAQVVHRLYGHRDAAENCSVGMWLSDATETLDELRAAERLAIFVGGTGLYFKALTHGLAAVPATPQAVRDAVRLRLDANGVEALHDELAALDPVMGERLGKRDRARVSRALEVMIATGRSLAHRQRDGQPPAIAKY
jgi:tRNA dimethylallyltransferase